MEDSPPDGTVPVDVNGTQLSQILVCMLVVQDSSRQEVDCCYCSTVCSARLVRILKIRGAYESTCRSYSKVNTMRPYCCIELVHVVLLSCAMDSAGVIELCHSQDKGTEELVSYSEEKVQLINNDMVKFNLKQRRTDAAHTSIYCCLAAACLDVLQCATVCLTLL